MAQELRVPILHYGPWNPMELNYLIEVQVGYVGGIMSLVAWDEVCHFRKAINYYKDGVLIHYSSWQSKYKIHANIFPRETWNREGSVKALRESATLGHLAYYAPLDHILNILIHARPIVVFFKHDKGLLFPKMAG